MHSRVAITGPAPFDASPVRRVVTEALPQAEISVCDASTLNEARISYDLLLVDARVGDPKSLVAAVSPRVARRRILVVSERDLSVARLANAHQFHGMLHVDAVPAIQAAIIRLVMAGGDYFPCFAMAGEQQADISAPSIQRLSRRQRQVLSLLLRGRTNKEIAEALGISLATAKLHVRAVLAEAGARNRTEAVLRFGALTATGEDSPAATPPRPAPEPPDRS